MLHLHISVPHPPSAKSPRQMSLEERKESSRQRDARCAGLRDRVETLLREGGISEAAVTVVGSAALYVTGLTEEARSSLASTLMAEDIPCHNLDGDAAMTFDAGEPVPPPTEEE